MRCRQENIIARSGTLPENGYYEELKLLSDVEKNKDTNRKMTTKYCSMIVTKLLSREQGK